MQPFLRIVRNPYEEPYHVNLIVAASNGRNFIQNGTKSKAAFVHR